MKTTIIVLTLLCIASYGQQPSDSFLDRGILFASRGDYERAIEDFTEALKQRPNTGAIYTLRGRAYVANASKVDSSTADFSEITVNPYYPITPEQTNGYEQAIKDFTNAIKLEPENAVNYHERGRVYDFKNDNDKAIADYSQAIKLEPNDAWAYFLRGCEYHFNKRDYDKAIADFNQAIKLNPDDQSAEAFLRLAVYEYNSNKPTLTDSRDRKKYKIIKIGTQTWMAENLNYNAKGSKCYNNKPVNCTKYGRLYDLETAKTACPGGWHLPSDAEWGVLVNYLVNYAGDSSTAGNRLKAKSGWNEGGNGYDSYGFAALPGGYGVDGRFYAVGNIGSWLSATEDNADILEMGYSYKDVHWIHSKRYFNDYVDVDWLNYVKIHLSSVRCLQD